MSSERDSDAFIDDIKKAMAYDLRLLFASDKEKTYTGQDVVKLIDNYIRANTRQIFI